jgi:hypothetical protein
MYLNCGVAKKCGIGLFCAAFCAFLLELAGEPVFAVKMALKRLKMSFPGISVSCGIGLVYDLKDNLTFRCVREGQTRSGELIFKRRLSSD